MTILEQLRDIYDPRASVIYLPLHDWLQYARELDDLILYTYLTKGLITSTDGRKCLTFRGTPVYVADAVAS